MLILVKLSKKFSGKVLIHFYVFCCEKFSLQKFYNSKSKLIFFTLQEFQDKKIVNRERVFIKMTDNLTNSVF